MNAVTTFLTQDGGFWVLTFVKIALLLFIVLTVNAYLTWFERKVVALMQSRVGPHRVGPHGLLQPAADGLKFLFKEDAMPGGVDKFVYLLAPFLALTLALASLAVIPFGPKPLPPPFTFFGHQIDLWITNPDIGQVSAPRRFAQLSPDGQLRTINDHVRRRCAADGQQF